MSYAVYITNTITPRNDRNKYRVSLLKNMFISDNTTRDISPTVKNVLYDNNLFVVVYPYIASIANKIIVPKSTAIILVVS